MSKLSGTKSSQNSRYEWTHSSEKRNFCFISLPVLSLCQTYSQSSCESWIWGFSHKWFSHKWFSMIFFLVLWWYSTQSRALEFWKCCPKVKNWVKEKNALNEYRSWVLFDVIEIIQTITFQHTNKIEDWFIFCVVLLFFVDSVCHHLTCRMCWNCFLHFVFKHCSTDVPSTWWLYCCTLASYIYPQLCLVLFVALLYRSNRQCFTDSQWEGLRIKKIFICDWVRWLHGQNKSSQTKQWKPSR